MKLIKNKKNRSRIKKGLLFAGLAGASIALLSQPALAAKGGKQYHEDEWKKTKTYGNTVIAEDSATEWGPWKQFIQPAAGPLAIAPMPGMRSDGSNYYRPESVEEYSPKYTLDKEDPIINPVVDPCQGGDWCGYMVQRSTNRITPTTDSGSITYERGSSVPTRMTIGFDAPDGLEGEGTLVYALTRLTDHYLEDVEGEYYNSGDIPVEYDGLLAHFYGSDDSDFDGHSPNDDDHLTYGQFNQWYGSNDARWGTSTDPDWQGGPFLAGNTTPLADMASRGEISGTIAFGGQSAGGADVSFEVNFADASWSGTWNRGSDSTVALHTDSNTGTEYVTGRVGFHAAGSITGADFRGAATTADDGIVTGTVVGNFFGDGASTLGGITDITKSRTDNAYDSARNVDVFVACEPSCLYED